MMILLVYQLLSFWYCSSGLSFSSSLDWRTQVRSLFASH